MRFVIIHIPQDKCFDVYDMEEKRNRGLGFGEKAFLLFKIPERRMDEIISKETLKPRAGSILISECELSVRTARILKEHKILNLNDLTSKSKSELLGYEGFGPKCLSEVRDILSITGLSLKSEF